MSKTPRTDAIQTAFNERDGMSVDDIVEAYEHARELECELNTARDLHGNAIHLLNEKTLKLAKLRTALCDLVDAVNVEFPGSMRDIGGKTGVALIQAVNALA